MWKKKWLFYFLFFICVDGINAQEDPAAALIKALNHKTFSAHFVQKIRDSNGEEALSTRGRLVIQRPNKFYWKTQKPEPILIVADGQFLWTYDIALSQVTKQGLQEVLQYSPAGLLSGDLSSLSTTFFITRKNDHYFLLRPKKEAPFSMILMGFSSGKLAEIKIHDPLGQEVHTLFSHVEVDKPVDSRLFHFTPPKGVSILEGGM